MSVIIYQDHIEILEEENYLLKKEVRFLRKQLGSNEYNYYKIKENES
tara:strand:+ start:142 stop:282 length:141 start_codon:yes stop_codon:yes gene_type:complete